MASLSGIQSLSGLETLNLCGTPIVTDALLCLSSQVHPRLLALNIANTPNVHGDLALQYLHDSGKSYVLCLLSGQSMREIDVHHLTRGVFCVPEKSWSQGPVCDVRPRSTWLRLGPSCLVLSALIGDKVGGSVA